MMNLSFPQYARDIQINFANVLSAAGTPSLSEFERSFVALAIVNSLQSPLLQEYIESSTISVLSSEQSDIAKSAAALMSMNNIYYRFIHMVGQKSYEHMPARLRMSTMQQKEVDKSLFELACLAVSAINGCGMCIQSHENQLVLHGISDIKIQDVVRLAAVLHAVAVIIR